MVVPRLLQVGALAALLRRDGLVARNHSDCSDLGELCVDRPASRGTLCCAHPHLAPHRQAGRISGGPGGAGGPAPRPGGFGPQWLGAGPNSSAPLHQNRRRPWGRSSSGHALASGGGGSGEAAMEVAGYSVGGNCGPAVVWWGPVGRLARRDGGCGEPGAAGARRRRPAGLPATKTDDESDDELHAYGHPADSRHPWAHAAPKHPPPDGLILGTMHRWHRWSTEVIHR